DKDVTRVQDFVARHDGIDAAQAKAGELVREAQTLLDACSPSVYRDALRTFATYVVEREK
ncbi:MAG: polyprenyl synthetase family protein, partial [Candidatus Kapaibacterium sp.]